MTDEVDEFADEVKPSAADKRKVYKVRNYVDAAQLRIDMSYSIASLSTAMSDQASLFVHYAGLAAKASRQVDDVAMLLEITEGKVYRKLRDEAVKNGTKLTEAQLDKMVSVHEQVVGMKRAKNEAKQIEANAKAAVEGFRQRRDMLIQEGANKRQELNGEVAVTARNERQDAVKNSQQRILSMMSERNGSA